MEDQAERLCLLGLTAFRQDDLQAYRRLALAEAAEALTAFPSITPYSSQHG